MKRIFTAFFVFATTGIAHSELQLSSAEERMKLHNSYAVLCFDKPGYVREHSKGYMKTYNAIAEEKGLDVAIISMKKSQIQGDALAKGVTANGNVMEFCKKGNELFNILR
ncbi:hypothetical protein [Ochrobactrum sp. BTU1]|uniref:hypothetical protein n=1 Tax=Ochrobactrum sp. BTU1 TaxID=2840456 RepID=UPI001C043223|nr:hypothetical protein KMS41_14100 [Ochrobactrum sp. BTU1]